MIVTCPSCSARFQYDDTRFDGVKSKRFRCPKCQDVFEAENPNFMRATTKSIDESLILAAMEGSQAPFTLPEPPLPPLPPKVHDHPEGADTTARRDRGAILSDTGNTDFGIPEDMRFTLAFLTGPNASMVRTLETPKVIIGREDGDIITHDPETSRRHASIEIRRDGTAWLRDLQSTNGTFIDGIRTQDAVQLTDRQEFTCGKSTFMMLIRRDDELHMV